MVGINIELNNETWIYIETISLTQKTLDDFKQRIPDKLMWRPILLSKIIKDPEFSVKTWSEKVPSYVITIILTCIDDILDQYSKEKEELDEMLEAPIDNLTDIELIDYIDKRNLLNIKIETLEENTREFTYNREKIRELSHNKIRKPKPLYIGYDQ